MPTGKIDVSKVLNLQAERIRSKTAEIDTTGQVLSGVGKVIGAIEKGQSQISKAQSDLDLAEQNLKTKQAQFDFNVREDEQNESISQDAASLDQGLSIIEENRRSGLLSNQAAKKQLKEQVELFAKKHGSGLIGRNRSVFRNINNNIRNRAKQLDGEIRREGLQREPLQFNKALNDYAINHSGNINSLKKFTDDKFLDGLISPYSEFTTEAHRQEYIAKNKSKFALSAANRFLIQNANSKGKLKKLKSSLTEIGLDINGVNTMSLAIERAEKALKAGDDPKTLHSKDFVRDYTSHLEAADESDLKSAITQLGKWSPTTAKGKESKRKLLLDSNLFLAGRRSISSPQSLSSINNLSGRDAWDLFSKKNEALLKRSTATGVTELRKQYISKWNKVRRKWKDGDRTGAVLDVIGSDGFKDQPLSFRTLLVGKDAHIFTKEEIGAQLNEDIIARLDSNQDVVRVAKSVVDKFEDIDPALRDAYEQKAYKQIMSALPEDRRILVNSQGVDRSFLQAIKIGDNAWSETLKQDKEAHKTVDAILKEEEGENITSFIESTFGEDMLFNNINNKAGVIDSLRNHVREMVYRTRDTEAAKRFIENYSQKMAEQLESDLVEGVSLPGLGRGTDTFSAVVSYAVEDVKRAFGAKYVADDEVLESRAIAQTRAGVDKFESFIMNGGQVAAFHRYLAADLFEMRLKGEIKDSDAARLQNTLGNLVASAEGGIAPVTDGLDDGVKIELRGAALKTIMKDANGQEIKLFKSDFNQFTDEKQIMMYFLDRLLPEDMPNRLNYITTFFEDRLRLGGRESDPAGRLIRDAGR